MPCHSGQEAGQGRAVDRLDLLAERGQRPAAELAEHVGVAPLPLDAVGPELAPDDAALAARAPSSTSRTGSRGRPKRRGHLAARKGRGCGRSGRPGPRGAARPDSVKASGSPSGTATPRASRSRPASSAAAKRSSPPTAAGMTRRASTSSSSHGPGVGDRTGASISSRPSGPSSAEQVVDLVGVACPAAVGEALELELEVGQDLGVDEIAQLLGAEQVAEQVPVEGEGGGPSLGQRRVALVHVDGDPAEQQRLGER